MDINMKLNSSFKGTARFTATDERGVSFGNLDVQLGAKVDELEVGKTYTVSIKEAKEKKQKEAEPAAEKS